MDGWHRASGRYAFGWNKNLAIMKNYHLLVLLLFVGTTSFSQYNYEWERHDLASKASIRGLHAVNENVVWLGGSGGLVARTIDGG